MPHTVTILDRKIFSFLHRELRHRGVPILLRITIGDVAVAEKEVYADEGVLLKDGLTRRQRLGYLS